MKRIGLLILGWLLVGLGIVGLFLPFLQGILFIMIGLAILSTRSKTVKHWLDYLGKRYPDHYRRIEGLKNRISEWFKKT